MATHLVTRVIRYKQQPTATSVVSQEVCPEHLCKMIEVWQNGKRVTSYCPICTREQTAEGLQDDK